jgi:hypothetical protein
MMAGMTVAMMAATMTTDAGPTSASRPAKTPVAM